MDELRELAGHVWRCASRLLRRSARLLLIMLAGFGFGFLAALGSRGVDPPSIEVSIEVKTEDSRADTFDNDYPYSTVLLPRLEETLPNTYYWQRPVHVGPVILGPWVAPASGHYDWEPAP